MCVEAALGASEWSCLHASCYHILRYHQHDLARMSCDEWADAALTVPVHSELLAILHSYHQAGSQCEKDSCPHSHIHAIF